jgi:hypothetical protein
MMSWPGGGPQNNQANFSPTRDLIKITPGYDPPIAATAPHNKKTQFSLGPKL